MSVFKLSTKLQKLKFSQQK